MNEDKILKNAQRTIGGGMLYKGTNYRMGIDGLAPVASMNPDVIRSMSGGDYPSMPSEALFKNGFGLGNMGLVNEQVYQDVLGGSYGSAIDSRPELKNFIDYQMKALTTMTGGAGTAGYAMVPIYVDPRVIDASRKFTPVVELMPRVANQGTTADFNRLTAKGAASFRGEDPALDEQNDTYERASVAIKYGYSVGRVTGPMIAAMPAYTMQDFNPAGTGLSGSTWASQAAPNAKQIEVLVKTRAMRELQENTIINGNSSTNPYEYDGIIVTQSTTNTVAKGSTALTLGDLYTAVQKAFDYGGRPSIAICSSSVYNDIQKLMMDQLRGVMPMSKLPWGAEFLSIRTMTGEIPILPSMFMSNVSGSKAIYFLDLSAIEMRVLQDLTYQELAKTGDSEKFYLKVYEALVIKNTKFNASVTAIA
jgi:hypothetical protein